MPVWNLDSRSHVGYLRTTYSPATHFVLTLYRLPTELWQCPALRTLCLRANRLTSDALGLTPGLARCAAPLEARADPRTAPPTISPTPSRLSPSSLTPPPCFSPSHPVDSPPTRPISPYLILSHPISSHLIPSRAASKVLDLGENKLGPAFPHVGSMAGLQHLHLPSNRIAELPAEQVP